MAIILSQQSNIKQELCQAALNELQNHAVDKLKSIENFKESGESTFSHKILFMVTIKLFLGVATLKIRVPCKEVGGTKLINLQEALTIDTSTNRS